MLLTLLPEILIDILHRLPNHDLLNVLLLSKNTSQFLTNFEVFWEQRTQREFFLSVNITFPKFGESLNESVMDKYVKIRKVINYFTRFNRAYVINFHDVFDIAYIKQLIEILSQQKDLSGLITHNTPLIKLWYNFIKRVICEKNIAIYGTKALVIIPLQYSDINRDVLDLIIQYAFEYLEIYGNDSNIEVFINNIVCENDVETACLTMRLLKHYRELRRNEKGGKAGKVKILMLTGNISSERQHIQALHRCCLYRVSQLTNTESVIKSIANNSSLAYSLAHSVPHLLEMLSMNKQQPIIDAILKEYYELLSNEDNESLDSIITCLSSPVNINILGSCTGLPIRHGDQIFSLKSSVTRYVERFPTSMTLENLKKIQKL